MPPLFVRVHNHLLGPFIGLLQKIVSALFRQRIFLYIFGRPKQHGEDKRIASARSLILHTPPDFLNEPLSTPPIDDHLRPPQSSKKKALLIGIEAINEMSKEQGLDIPIRPLRGSHKDIRDMRQFLIDRWNYDPFDIRVLINTDDPGQALPTKENIERNCIEMVAGARTGDRFFFHFAGHTTHKPTDGKEEEDGEDEYILTCDNEVIQDDTLRKVLVDPLPAGAKLVAVFDACNSGTLLDLEHYRCNRVYVPWVNKGFRRTESRWNIVVRRFAQIARSMNTENTGLPAINSGSSLMRSPTTLPAQVVGEIFPIPPIQRSETMSENPASDSGGSWYNCLEIPMIRCDSPDPYLCTGHCNQHVPQPRFEVSDYADVICLSYAKDCQRPYQEESSLTQAFMKFLWRKPDATIEDVLTAVSHELHAFYLDLYQHACKYKHQTRDTNKRRQIRGKPPFREQTLEMVNFQDPQISSHKPLDMKRRWEM